MDEITTTGETYCAKLYNGRIEECVLHPSDFGLEIANPDDLIGGEPEENATALREILAGRKNAYRDIVTANAAAVLMISGQSTDLKDAVKTVQNVLDNGEAASLLGQYIEFTQTYGEKAA